MTFSASFCNPPYNSPGTKGLYMKFAGLLMKISSKMTIVHPKGWRNSTIYTKFADKVREHLVEITITDYDEIFVGVGVAVDWYVWDRSHTGTALLKYPNCTDTIIGKTDMIYDSLLSKDEIAYLDGFYTTKIDNGASIRNSHFASDHYNKARPRKDVIAQHPAIGGKGKSLSGKPFNTSWCEEPFEYAYYSVPQQDHDKNKVVISYVRKPRARYIKAEEGIGVMCANYWIVDDEELALKMVELFNDPEFYRVMMKISNSRQMQSLHWKCIDLGKISKTKKDAF